jgi:Zn-dependent protease
VELRAHWLLLILPIGELLSRTLGPAAPYGAPFLSWAASMTALCIALGIHELGHLLWTERQGGRTERILLWPLGGMAAAELPETPRAHLLAALSGPAFTALGLAAAAAACLASGRDLLPPAEAPPTFPYLQALGQYLVLWNAYFLLLNLLPCAPLDGGRLLEAALWSRLESRWQARLLATRVGLATAIGAGGAAVLFFLASFFLDRDFGLRHPLLQALSWGLVLVAVMAYLDHKLAELRDGPGEEDAGVFGYDFSSGYTSLEQTATRRSKRKVPLLTRLRDARRKRARARRDQADAAMKLQLDLLLAKIHEQGMESLTPAERRFLERASKHLRQ